MECTKNKLNSQNAYRAIFLLLHRKLWFQLKFLIQDLIILSSYISFIFLEENKNLCFFNGKKLLFFYQKFKQFLRKFIQIRKLNTFLLYVTKNELVYTEDRIIFLENELYTFKRFQKSQFSFILTLNLLSKYYIWLKNNDNKKNWIKQCNVIQKKILEQKGKKNFSRNLSQLTRIFFVRTMNDCCIQNVGEKLSWNFVTPRFVERKKIVHKTKNFLLKKKEEEKKVSWEKKQFNFSLICTDFHPKLLEISFNSNNRRNFDKQYCLFGMNLFRIKRKTRIRSFFLEKPEFNPYFLTWFLSWQENRQFASLFKLQIISKNKNRIRWSILTKIMKIYFREIQYFSLNYKKKDTPLNFLNHSRQLIYVNLFSEHISSHITRSEKNFEILMKKIIVPFLCFNRKFFQGWSY